MLVGAYESGGFDEVRKALPSRTLRACRVRYWEIGGKLASQPASEQSTKYKALSNEPWTSDEDATFVAAYGVGGMAEVYRRLPNRSPKSCARRLAKLRYEGVAALQRQNLPLQVRTVAPEASSGRAETTDFAVSALRRMATDVDSIAPFNAHKGGIAKYVQQPEFADAYEFIRRRILFEINAMAKQLSLPPEVVARTVQVLSAYDFLPGQSIRRADD